jgi:hypothetical protein
LHIGFLIYGIKILFNSSTSRSITIIMSSYFFVFVCWNLL